MSTPEQDQVVDSTVDSTAAQSVVVGGVIGGPATADPGDPVAPAPEYDRDPPTSPIPAQRAEPKKGLLARLFSRS
ncbi:hypothetical protein [Actinokineospora bangkokensis]|uniref:Uncharacterized protein n=1 Tax=Actinokineospora bangkokensis TaxID=1193682 RepID=A0A1Q9LQD8_9PSEU|nr:hypothetical protein [Actinokineospora bangkokensis]OLR94211.1 hypothetical protein BJP25_10495 [Actinokineospora bangkokensis]